MPPRLLIPTYAWSSVGTDRDKVDAKGLKLTNNILHHVLRTLHICIRMHNILYTDKIIIILKVDASSILFLYGH